MARPKKSAEFVDDGTPGGETEGEMQSGADGAPESAADALPEDDLIGELEPREPEPAGAASEEADAAGDVALDVEEDKQPELPPEFVGMATAPMVGIRVVLVTPAGDFLRAFHKRSRRFIDRRWQMSGKWCDAATGKDLEFEPLGWRSLRPGE